MDTLPPPHPAKAPGSVWPKTLGIISIVFGVGGLSQALIGPLSLLLTRQQMLAYVKMGVEQERVDDYLNRLSAITYPSSAAYGVLGILLLSGGILLIKKRRIAPILLQVWAALKVITGGISIFSMMGLTKDQMSIMMDGMPRTSSNGGLEAMNQITNAATTVGLVFGFVWLCALPVFFLVWFNRRKIADQVRAW